jgi:predicted HicB family RNase H-like nuclease
MQWSQWIFSGRSVTIPASPLLANKERLPAATAGKTYSGKFVVRIGPELHQKAAIKASARGESLNQFGAAAIASA